MKNEHDQSWDFSHTHSIRLPAQESHKHETTKLLNFTVSSTRCPAPASANAPGHSSLRALSLGKCVRRCCLGSRLLCQPCRPWVPQAVVPAQVLDAVNSLPACPCRAYSMHCLGSSTAAAGLQASLERARGRDRLDLAPLTSTRGAAANRPDATTPTCTRSKPTRETKIPEGKTTRFHSNQKPSEGTGEKGLHSLRITVQVFKNSWEISKPRRGEGGRKRRSRKSKRTGRREW